MASRSVTEIAPPATEDKGFANALYLKRGTNVDW
jgi:hypothetical protein